MKRIEIAIKKRKTYEPPTAEVVFMDMQLMKDTMSLPVGDGDGDGNTDDDWAKQNGGDVWEDEDDEE